VGRFVIRKLVEAGLRIAGGGYSSWHASFQVYRQNDGISWEGRQSLTVEQDGREVWDGTAQPGIHVFTMPVVFGDILRFSMFADVEARTGAQALYSGPGATGRDQSAFFMNTMAWGGILGLTDA